MHIATKTANLKIEVSGIESIAQSGRWLGRSLETEHALVRRDGRPSCRWDRLVATAYARPIQQVHRLIDYR